MRWIALLIEQRFANFFQPRPFFVLLCCVVNAVMDDGTKKILLLKTNLKKVP